MSAYDRANQFPITAYINSEAVQALQLAESCSAEMSKPTHSRQREHLLIMMHLYVPSSMTKHRDVEGRLAS
jgi:hypothetical protein